MQLRTNSRTQNRMRSQRAPSPSFRRPIITRPFIHMHSPPFRHPIIFSYPIIKHPITHPTHPFPSSRIRTRNQGTYTKVHRRNIHRTRPFRKYMQR